MTTRTVSRMWILLLMCACSGPGNATDDLESRSKAKLDPNFRIVPVNDPNTHLLQSTDLENFVAATLAEPGYFDQPVPYTLHLIDVTGLTTQGPRQHALWHTYAEEFGFEVNVWTAQDVNRLMSQAYEPLQDAVREATHQGRPDVVQHLMGLEILRQQGGIWVGPNVMPPRIDGQYIALDRVAPMRGLTLATNHRARKVGGASLYITTALMFSNPNHPWLTAVSDTAAKNVTQLLTQKKSDLPARYYAGNALLSRNLMGVYGILPYKYLQSLNVFPDPDNNSLEDALE